MPLIFGVLFTSYTAVTPLTLIKLALEERTEIAGASIIKTPRRVKHNRKN
jgi:hypothetical protein